MPTAFVNIPPDGPYVYADPQSDLDYSLASWLEGQVFSAVTWAIVPNVVGALHNPTLNAAPVTVDGRAYAINELATVWAKLLVAGTDYLVTASATFGGGQADERSFTIRCRER